MLAFKERLGDLACGALKEEDGEINHSVQKVCFKKHTRPAFPPANVSGIPRARPQCEVREGRAEAADSR